MSDREQGALGIDAAAAYLGIGKSTLHALVAADKKANRKRGSRKAPASVKVGRRRLFRVEALDRWLADLEAAQAGQ